jgi:hypothetical protein
MQHIKTTQRVKKNELEKVEYILAVESVEHCSHQEDKDIYLSSCEKLNFQSAFQTIFVILPGGLSSVTYALDFADIKLL